MAHHVQPTSTTTAASLDEMDTDTSRALSMLMELAPTIHDRARVSGIVMHDAAVLRAIVEAIDRVRRAVPDARIELVSDPESELDLPLTLEARLPRPYAEFWALRQELQRWWIESHPHARTRVLFAVFPGGTG
jgi:hypothetical protein